jgi:hypothetical protein
VRAAAPIAPKSIRLLTVVVEAGLEMSTTRIDQSRREPCGWILARVRLGVADRRFPGMKSGEEEEEAAGA